MAGFHRIDHGVNFQHGRDVDRFTLLVHFRHQAVVERFALGFIGDSFQFATETQAHGAFEAHTAELARGPGDGEQRSVKTARGHGHRSQAVALAQHHAHERNAGGRAGDVHPADMAHLRLLLDLGADHEARRVAKRQNRNAEGVAKLNEARGLVGAWSVDRAGKMFGIVGDQADWAAFYADQRGDHADAELRPQLEHGVFIRQRLDHFADVVNAQAIFRNQLTQAALIGRLPAWQRALKVRKILASSLHGLHLIAHANVHHAVSGLGVYRSDLLRPEDAQSPALNHGRTAHADVRVLGGDDHVAASHQRRVARKTIARDDAHQRNLAAELGEIDEAGSIETTYGNGVGIAGPAAAAFGK